MLNKNLMIGMIIFLGGLVTGIVGFNQFHHCPEIKQEGAVTTNASNVHTTTTTNTISVADVKPAKMRYVPVSSTPNPSRLNLTGKDTINRKDSKPFADMEIVSSYDTATSAGFEAHIEYWHNANEFHNSFKYPEKTISRDSSYYFSKEMNSLVIKKEIPTWQLGIGTGVKLIDSKINYRFFPLIDFNMKLLFANLTIEGQGDIHWGAGNFSLDPGILAKLTVGL